MLWLMILFFLLAATFNSSVDSAQSNYYKKIVIEHNGKKYINPYAFSDMNFTLETSVVEDFYFIVRKSDREVIPIKMSLSTDSPSTNVICNANRNTMVCETPSHDTVALETQFQDHTIELYGGYDYNGLHFSKDGLKYLLKSSSTFTPAYDTPLSSFLMEWPSSINLQESQEQVQEAVIPPNYVVCEDSCDSLKNETGVTFGSKGTVEFTMALLDKENEYKLLHSFGYFSPIYTLSGSTSCTNYSTTVNLNGKGSLTFTRDGEKMDIDTDFKPLQESLKDVSISNASNVNFYFYGSSIYFTFFDPQNAFQLRLLKLPKDLAESMKSETILKIGHSSTVNECNDTLKLLVGNGVKLLFPKSNTSSSTVEPFNTILPANVTEIAKTSKPANKTEEASFPLWAIILIGSVAGILLIGGLAFAIFCLIKKRQNKSPKKAENLSISELERRMLAKKPKKNEMDKNDEIGPEKKAEKKDEKKAEKKAGKKVEKKKTKEFSLIPTAALPSPPKLPSEKEMNASAKQTLLNKISKRRDEQEKLEKRLQEKKRRQEEEKIRQEEEKNRPDEEENGPEEEKYTTTEDGQPPLTAIAKTKTKSVSKTQTEAVEVGGTQTTQNSIQQSKSSTPEDLKQLPRKEMVLKSKTKTKTTDGTAPT